MHQTKAASISKRQCLRKGSFAGHRKAAVPTALRVATNALPKVESVGRCLGAGIGGRGVAFGFALEIEFDRVEYAIDELRGLKGRKTPCDLKSFIYHHRVRRVFEKEFVNREAENVTVNDRHSLNTPMLGPGPYLIVQRRDVSERAVYKFVREGAEAVVEVRITEFVPVALGCKIGRIADHIGREKHL